MVNINCYVTSEITWNVVRSWKANDWQLLYTFNSTLIENTGTFVITSPSASLCTEQNSRSHCSNFSFGAFRIRAEWHRSGNGSSVRPTHRPPCANGTTGAP